ncbi:hypothetical protein LHYA1_G001137 [Lachnellula hyalina]|uniref:Fungal lipase-type domain-containing protein n=1 Tax=Lachnellula hyalina TaxID=1316788 RepID=A0A8H8R836_9HELO|nr:uncharacterized protein LHYA1_G001137 [Lachnellula hyalina]TVY30155.1 hypothetical protein LHYA1_G001137 [Lachnellula hyalina]
MAIFGKSKKSKQKTSQPQNPLAYPSRTDLHAPNRNIPQQSWSDNQNNDPQSNGTPQLQASAIWLAPQNQPVPITQNLPPLLPERPHRPGNTISRLNLSSMSNLLDQGVPQYVPGARYINNGGLAGTQYLNQGAALCDLISSKFDTVITLIDGDKFNGDEGEFVVHQAAQQMWPQAQESDRSLMRSGNHSVSNALIGANYFDKVNLYANSRLPPNLPPMKLYMPTFPLLCLAAQYSERVYSKPGGQEKETHVDSDWRTGTKAMVIKSVPMDDMNTIVFAIRGTQTFMDWAVNFNSAPTAPEGLLDDPGNLCHAGFLTVARKMVKPVAARLRHLLQENPSRAKYSLLITGHSAGGAVASLLYCHMLSTTPETESELNILTGCFKRIHCVSFGAPPISLLPLTKPQTPLQKKSIFMSFVNEGDPVARADKAYVRSLLDLYSSPSPGQACLAGLAPQKLLTGARSSSSLAIDKMKMRPKPKKSNTAPAHSVQPVWNVPEATLSNAGRLVLLRSAGPLRGSGGKRERMNEGVVAQMVSDDLLRGVIFGDPMCHEMKLYARRVEILATNAVMGRS